MIGLQPCQFNCILIKINQLTRHVAKYLEKLQEYFTPDQVILLWLLSSFTSFCPPFMSLFLSDWPCDQLRDVIGNNPNIFLTNWWEVEESMEYLQVQKYYIWTHLFMEVHTCSEYLQGVMSVSARRVALTPSSLTLPREFYYRRYQVLVITGLFRALPGLYPLHPPPVPAEVWPLQASRPRG